MNHIESPHNFFQSFQHLHNQSVSEKPYPSWLPEGSTLVIGIWSWRLPKSYCIHTVLLLAFTISKGHSEVGVYSIIVRCAASFFFFYL